MSSWLSKPRLKKPQFKVPTPQIIESGRNDIKTNITLPSKEVLDLNSYNDITTKIQNFNNMHNSLITFVIPSINRDTLYSTLVSLQKQKIDNWKAIIIFDGCYPTNPKILELLKDSHFLYFTINKTGKYKDIIHGVSGFVRNIGINIVSTSWVGFVDDDDTLMPDYTEKLIEEIRTTPDVDVISFRMINNGQIYLPPHLNTIEKNNIGISFCYKSHLIGDGFIFDQCDTEDYNLLIKFKNSNKKIVISPYVVYVVGKYEYNNNDKLKRIIIN